MRTAKVFTNLVCNQGCRHCNSRAATDDPAFVAASAVRGRVADATSGGASEIVLTGGEPTMRRDLAAIVAQARAGGATVGVETNATLLTRERVDALVAAGLAFARVNLAMWGDALDELTRDPGGFERTRAGLHALAAAGVPIEIAATVLRPTLASLAGLADALAADLGAGAIRAILVSVPVESPDAGLLVPYEEAVPAIVALDAAGKRVGIRIQIAPDSGPPPCFFPHQSRIAHLYTMTPGITERPDFAHVDACAACAARDRCLGISRAYLAERQLPALRPVTEDRVRRRLSIASSVDEQIARELVAPNRYRLPSGESVEERIVRVNFQCNQACSFCFVSTHLPTAEEAAVRRAIEEAGAIGARIVLSGGEPTLNPRLTEYVRLAKQVAKHGVEIQTNATLLDDPARVDALVAAGLDTAFVSLHGATAEVSDAVTEAPGTYVRTLVGIDNLTARGVAVTLNFVLCGSNRGHLPRVVQTMASRWPGTRLCVSFVAASTDVVPLTRELVPRYSDVLPEIAMALDEAARLGVHVHGFDTMCGIPLCLVPAGKESFFGLAAIPEGDDGGEFVKADACATCALSDRCFGIRRRYVELHGADELRPVAGTQPAG